MKKPLPTYWSMLIAPVRYSRKINGEEKVLFSEITALTNKEGYCWATNGHFAELFDCDGRTIIRQLNRLEEAGFIECRQEGGRRIIVPMGVDKNVMGVGQKRHLGGDKNDTPLYSTKKSTLTEQEEEPLPEALIKIEGFKEAWEQNLQMRREQKYKKLGPTALRGRFKFLLAQPDPVQCLREATDGAWQGVFTAKGNGNGSNRQSGGSRQRGGPTAADLHLLTR